MATFLDENIPTGHLARTAEIVTDLQGRKFAQVDDMLLPLRSGEARILDVSGSAWPDGQVTYVFDISVTKSEWKTAFREACRLWALRARLTFTELAVKPDSKQINYILVKNHSSKNSSVVGMVKGEQVLNLVSWGTRLTIVHEIGHALGLIHEHVRSDRETYVSIIKDNIINDTTYKNNFAIYPANSVQGPYDFSSIMHYDLNAFGKYDEHNKVKLPTIQVREPYKTLSYFCGQDFFLSYLDAQAVAERYGATNFPTYTKLDARTWPTTKVSHTFSAVTDALRGAVFYDIAVPGPTQVGAVTLSTLSMKTGDCDLYVRRVPIKDENDWMKSEHFASPIKGKREEWKSIKKGNRDQVQITNGPLAAASVRYLVMLYASSAYEDVSLQILLTRG